MSDYKITLYQKPDGSCPVSEFIEELDNKMQAKIFKTIDLLRDYGPQLEMPYSRSLEDGILELRVQTHGDITRILYFFVIGKEAILTNGFTKKTNKTPENEKQRAKKYRAEYLSRKGNG